MSKYSDVSGSSSINTPSVAEREHQIPNQMKSLSSGLEDLENKLHCLEDRLGRVLVSSLPTPAGTSKDVPTPLVDLADELKSFHYHVNNLVDLVDSILDRLEL